MDLNLALEALASKLQRIRLECHGDPELTHLKADKAIISFFKELGLEEAEKVVEVYQEMSQNFWYA